MTEAYYIQAIQKHRFTIYIKCYDRQILSVFDLLTDTGYKIDSVSDGYFEVLEKKSRVGELHGGHVIVFQSSDSYSKIDEKLVSLR